MNLFAMMETSGGAMQAERMRAEVVATNMAELAQCGDLLYIGHDAEDFAQRLTQSVHAGTPPPACGLRCQ